MPRPHAPAAATAAVLLGLLALPATAGAVATATLSGGTLAIAGDAAPDTIRVAAGGSGAIAVDLDGDGTSDASFSAAAVARVDVAGGLGADAVTIGDGLGEAVVVAGGDGNDTLTGGDGDERFTWVPGDDNDVIDGGAGSDTLDFNGAAVSESMTLAPFGAPGHVQLFRNVASVVMDLVRVDRLSLRLSGGADSFSAGAGVAALLPLVEVDGGDGADTLTGGDEADVLVGGNGTDTLGGGAGDDLFRVDATDAAEADAIAGGDGADRLAVTGTVGRDTFSVSSPGAGQVTVQDVGANRAWTATAEGVAIDAGAGDDQVDVPAGLVPVDAWGGDGDDVLHGSSGADHLDGGPGRDVLRALGGADVLSGGTGKDVLAGGAGADAFSCDGASDVLDATAEDAVAADCLPPVALPPAPGPVVVTVPGPSVLVPVPGAAADVRAPAIALRGVPATIKRSALLKSGLSVRVAADERAALSGELLATARGARIAAARPNLTLAAKALPVAAAGTRTLTLKPSRKLVGTAKRFTLTVRVTATDAAGNRGTATRTVKVR